MAIFISDKTDFKEKLLQEIKMDIIRGSWVAQWVKCPTLAQVIISRYMSSSPALGSVLTAQSMEPASDSVFPPLSAPPLLTLCLPPSQKMNKC